jgi:hypothetical protein
LRSIYVQPPRLTRSYTFLPTCSYTQCPPYREREDGIHYSSPPAAPNKNTPAKTRNFLGSRNDRSCFGHTTEIFLYTLVPFATMGPRTAPPILHPRHPAKGNLEQDIIDASCSSTRVLGETPAILRASPIQHAPQSFILGIAFRCWNLPAHPSHAEDQCNLEYSIPLRHVTFPPMLRSTV